MTDPTTDTEPASTGQDALRQRIAQALVRYDWNAGLSGRVTPSEHHYGEADAVLAVLPPTADRAAVLTAAERKFLTFALDLAFDRMVSDDGFTDEDEAALKSLRRMADEQ